MSLRLKQMVCVLLAARWGATWGYRYLYHWRLKVGRLMGENEFDDECEHADSEYESWRDKFKAM